MQLREHDWSVVLQNPCGSPEHLRLGALRPVVSGQRALDRDRGRERVGGAAEGDEEGVALAVDLLAPMRDEGLPEQLEQSGRALDVREQEGDGAAQTLRREPPWGEGSLGAGLVSNCASAARPVRT